jgi:putative ABC transport system permease protein
MAARRLRRRPGYAAAHIALLALSIGVNAAVFTLYETLFLRPLPFGRPERLVSLLATFPSTDGKLEEYAGSPLDFVRWRERSRLLEEVAAATPRDMSLGEAEAAQSVVAEMASASLFPLLGTAPERGRVFSAEEDRDDSGVVVLSHGLWTRRFGASPDLVGRTVRIDGTPRTVLGIMPPGFTPTFSRAELWVPLGIDAGHLGRRGSRYLALVARLKPGVTSAQAEAELASLNEGLRAESPDTHAGWGVRVKGMRENYFGARRPAVVVLLLAVAALLLVACSNLAHLALTRAVSRRGELALRVALGASQRRLLADAALEALLLGGAGAALGLIVAFLALPSAIALDADLGRLAGGARPDLAVLAFAAATTLFAATLTGLLPAWRVTRGLSGGGEAGAGARVAGDAGDSRLRQALVVAQVMLSVVLLSAAALLVKTVLRLQRAPHGFRSEGLVAAQIVLPPSRYQEAAARAAFVDHLLEKVRSTPGVTAAAVTMTRFQAATSMQAGISIEGRQERKGEDLTVHFRRISPGYVRAMGTWLVAGREFEATDGPDGPPVALVNASFVRHYLGGGDAVGHRLRRVSAAAKWLAIVGVVADVKDLGLGGDAPPTLYTPYAQGSVAGMSFAPITLVLRGASGDGVPPAALAAAARAAVAAIDPDLAIEPPVTVESALSASLSPQRLQAGLLAVFAATALVLAAVGLYGVTSYGVAQRTREIGIRVALGASGRAVLGMVVAGTIRAVALGTVLGVAGTWLLRWMLGHLVSGAAEWDAPTVSAMAGLLVVVAAAAAYIPARRCARLDPAVALREG